ncbi:MAG: glutamate-1-semialdehyde 2,1-aminomutase [Armatimonadetes bacterium]|nr:glutamate-1-semialdehyde 2,1-aminomutase [Armatimonadota bacterium]NIM23425.1 glutamate-1-semialdehyde 2,1-aminomutase [Armatimonadota bacterium]NIM67290.1 glutamate-1-semialdehyde 2,1-aminomutase [Armatimonadota bacterium]NIM75788.1 glutamate-1-semialdehyde 2,1-aminomutase [Armatimonadota bacterium]NIN05476.1 glutamate-1-semialdehyde 2,1-aminomutase [Armatimonadota bacterium]
MSRSQSKSESLFAEAQGLIPGGVNSPVRAFKAVGGTPPFMARGAGATVWDVDGNEYIDCVASWGPLILGHARREVVESIRETAGRGMTFGAPTELEVALARLIVEAVPSIELVRLVNSGTEAVMSALRLARAFTGRSKVVKFEGGYHGHSDGLLARAGSGLATLSIPDCPGVPDAWAAETLVVPYNDLEVVQELLVSRGKEIACVIIEPVAGNMGVVPPKEGFLEGIRQATEQVGCLLIFDEVITGFRVHYGGAQTLHKVTPDLTVLGKIIGGGLPIGAFGGRREIMEMLAPSGPVYQAGTLSGNPVACAAGLATLRILAAEKPYAMLERRAQSLVEELQQAASRLNIPVTINRVGSMFTLFFSEGPVANYATASASDKSRYAKFFHSMLEQGVYLPPSQFEAMFLSTAHSDVEVERIGDAAKSALEQLAAD